MAKKLTLISILLAAFGLASEASAQGLVRILANTPASLSTMAAAAENPVRLIITLKTPQPAAVKTINIARLTTAVADAQDRTRKSLSWLIKEELPWYRYVPAISLSANKSQLEELLASDHVAAVYEEQPLFLSLDSSGPVIGKARAQALNATGAGQVVAILDSGFDVTHPFLAGRIVAEACFSTPGSAAQPSPSGFSNCPGGTAEEKGPGASRFNAVPNYEGVEHGTHVAGIVAGRGPDFNGVAPEAQLMLANVFKRQNISKCPKWMAGKYAGCISTMPSSIISAMEWIFEQREDFNIAAVNLSLGGGKSATVCDREDPLTRIFNLVRSAEIAIVVSSGNASFKDAISLPACLSSAISVGATSDSDQVAKFSNSAAMLDILAPGVEITSSVPGGAFAVMSGTSMAAPQVAGAFAALRSARPTATVNEMLKALIDTGVSVTDTNGIVKQRIQIDKAVAALKAGGSTSDASPTPKPKTDGVTNVGGITVRKSPSGKLRPKKGNKAINADGSIKW